MMIPTSDYTVNLRRQISVDLPSSSTHDRAVGSVSRAREFVILQTSPEDRFSEPGNRPLLYSNFVKNTFWTEGKKRMYKLDNPDRIPISQLDDWPKPARRAWL